MSSCCHAHTGPHLHGCTLPATPDGRDHPGPCILTPTRPTEGDQPMTVTTLHPRRPAEVCPASHHEPNPSRPASCPPWCDRQHPARLWLACCCAVVHGRSLGQTDDRGVIIRLTAAEDADGLDSPRVMVFADSDLLDLTPGQADHYADTLHRAATRARQIIGQNRELS